MDSVFFCHVIEQMHPAVPRTRAASESYKFIDGWYGQTDWSLGHSDMTSGRNNNRASRTTTLSILMTSLRLFHLVLGCTVGTPTFRLLCFTRLSEDKSERVWRHTSKRPHTFDHDLMCTSMSPPDTPELQPEELGTSHCARHGGRVEGGQGEGGGSGTDGFDPGEMAESRLEGRN